MEHSPEALVHDKLKVLSFFHFAGCFVDIACIGLAYLEHQGLQRLLAHPLMVEALQQNPMPYTIQSIFSALFPIVTALLLVFALLNLASALCIAKKRYWHFSFAVACCNSLFFPYGTGLAVYSFFVLLRSDIQQAYSRHSPAQF